MKKDGLLFFDDFTGDSGIWTADGTISRGRAEASDGVMYLKHHSLGFTTLPCGILTKPEYSGRTDRAVGDIMIDRIDCSAGYFFCFNTKGYYIARVQLFMKNGKAEANFHIMKQYSRHTGLLTLFESPDLSSFGLKIEANKWFNLDVSLSAGRFVALVDGVKVCDCKDEGDFFSAGQFGMRATAGDACYKNLSVYGKAGPYSSMKPEPVYPPSSFEVSAESAKEGERPCELCEYVGKSDWKVKDIDGNKEIYTDRAEHAVCWVHAYEKDPTVKADIRLHGAGEKARFGIFARFGIDESYVRFGYDAKEGCWYCEHCEGPDFKPVRINGEKARVEVGSVYNMCAKLNGRQVEFSVNGKVCLTSGAVAHEGWGRCGVYGDDAAISFPKLACDFPNGGRVLRGVITNTLFPKEYINSLEVERLDKDTVIAFMREFRALSKDGGVTFTDVSKEYSDLNRDGEYSSVLHLKSGDFLQFNYVNSLTVERSSDLKNWKKWADLTDGGRNTDEQGRSLTILHVSTPTELKMSDGHERIFLPVANRRFREERIPGHYTRVFYSDDEGRTWQESKNDTRTLIDQPDGQSSWSESKVIRGSDGALRMYYTRNQLGCVAYTSSYDEGVTWTGLELIPEMPCGMSSFGVCEDPCERGTFFMAYVKNIPYNDTLLFPRSHIVLVRTRDGVTWEEIADIDRFSQPSDGTFGSELYQILDPAITVCDDYIYVCYGRGNGYLPTYHNAQRARYVRIDRKVAGI